MDNNYNIINLILNNALFGKNLPIPKDVDWQAVYQEMSDQSLTGLIGPVLGSIPDMDPELKSQWKREVIAQVHRYYRYLDIQEEVLSVLRSHQIPCVVLKGCAAGMYYPNPEYRAMGDIDLLVHPKDFNRSVEILLENGYKEYEHTPDRDREFIVQKQGCTIELHKTFLGIDESKIYHSEIFDKCIYDGIERSEVYRADIYKIPVLPKLSNGLVLLKHVYQHLYNNLGMRQIVDWMMYVNEHLDDAYWSEVFQKEIRAYGLETLAVTVTRMCQLYLGLSETNRTWCMKADEKVCHNLMQHIVKNGNMGRKLVKVDEIGSIFIYKKGIGSMVRNLQSDGVKGWKILEKAPFLKPFAWIYQICHYVHRWFYHGAKVGQLFEYEGEAKRVRHLYEQLELPKYENNKMR